VHSVVQVILVKTLECNRTRNQDRIWNFKGVMAASRDGMGQERSTSLVSWEGEGEGASTPSRDGCDQKGLRIPQAVKGEITGDRRVIAEPGWDTEPSPLWVCHTARKYVKMCHIDKLFPEAVWSYNHRNSGLKPKDCISKHFAHRALEVWSTLFPNKPFGPDNKNIISYSMAAMIYAEIELKKDVDWRTVFTRKKEDRTEYAKADIPDNFSFFREDVEDGPAPDARGVNRSTLGGGKAVEDSDSVGNGICSGKGKSRSEDEEDAIASQKLDSAITRLFSTDH